MCGGGFMRRPLVVCNPYRTSPRNQHILCRMHPQLLYRKSGVLISCLLFAYLSTNQVGLSRSVQLVQKRRKTALASLVHVNTKSLSSPSLVPNQVPRSVSVTLNIRSCPVLTTEGGVGGRDRRSSCRGSGWHQARERIDR